MIIEQHNETIFFDIKEDDPEDDDDLIIPDFFNKRDHDQD